MPYLDQLFEKKGLPALGGPQCYEGRVVATSPQGAYVVLPNFDRFLRWGPCQPPDAGVALGDEVSITLSEDGVPWLIGVKGGGAVGPPGPEGPTGPSGPSGPTGPSGPKGDPGTAGQTGAQGPTGPIGPQGPNGATGATGPTGAQGPKGDKGDTGATGPAGSVEIAFRNGGWGDVSSPGVNVWTNVAIKCTGTPGTITPAGAFVENADGSLTVRDAGWYDIEVTVAFTAAGIHTLSVGPSPAAQNYQVMASTSGGGGQLAGASAVPLAAGAKLYLTQNSNIAGQVQMVTFSVTKVGAGPQGPGGPQGVSGPAGLTGPAGPQGPVGAASTVPGPTGPTGPQGAQGAQGPKGDTGATGATGPAAAIWLPCSIYRSANWTLAAGWQGIGWDQVEPGGDASLWNGSAFVASATGCYQYVISVLLQNAQGGTIDVALGYNSSGYTRHQVANTFYLGLNYVRTFMNLPAGTTITPTIWVSAVGGLGVVAQAGAAATYAQFKRVA